MSTISTLHTGSEVQQTLQFSFTQGPILRFHVATGVLRVRQGDSASFQDRQRRQKDDIEHQLEIVDEHASRAANLRQTTTQSDISALYRLRITRKARLFGDKREFGTLVTRSNARRDVIDSLSHRLESRPGTRTRSRQRHHSASCDLFETFRSTRRPKGKRTRRMSE